MHYTLADSKGATEHVVVVDRAPGSRSSGAGMRDMPPWSSTIRASAQMNEERETV